MKPSAVLSDSTSSVSGEVEEWVSMVTAHLPIALAYTHPFQHNSEYYY